MKTTTVFETGSNAKTKRRAERDRLRVAAAERAMAEDSVAEVERAAQAAKDKEWQQRAAAWVVGQRAAGWPSYGRAVFALAKLGVAWEKSDAPPPSSDPPEDGAEVGARQYMRRWHESSRWAGNGLSPEDVAREILATPVS